ncbi:helix-turn-helix domain-containing protein [Streptomyces shenzhenensis]|uniref:helix-turn-helix domain-containing protein n=1 Tax=Streptomyces shenzhenensis TaxID=943815 RepID=UPI0036D063F2
MPRRRNPYPDWVVTRRLQLGHRIASRRKAAGISQDALAERTGMDRRSIQRYEAGRRDPGFSDLLLIADALDVPVTYLVQDKEGPRPAYPTGA